MLRAGAEFSWGNYLTARLTRLWVVLIPCLFITWAIGLIIGHYAPSVLAGANIDSWHSGPKLGEYSTGFSTLLANIFFMQTIISPVYGLNSPLWSLANEFWYYLLFPLLTVAIGSVRASQHKIRAAVFILAMIIAWCLPKEMLYAFLIWMIGVGVYCLQSTIKLNNPAITRVYLLITVGMFGFALIYARSTMLHQTLVIEPDFVVGLTFGFLCLVLTNQSFPVLSQPWLAKCSLYLSEMSYSLYLSHFPIVILIATTVYSSKRDAPNVLGIAQFIGWVGLMLTIAGGLWWLFESRTALVRAKVTTLVNSMLKVSLR